MPKPKNKKRDLLVIQLMLLAGAAYLIMKYMVITLPLILVGAGVSVYFYIKSPRFKNWVRVRIFKKKPLDIKKDEPLHPKKNDAAKINTRQFTDQQLVNELLINRTDAKLIVNDNPNIKKLSNDELVKELVNRGLLNG